MVNDGVRRKILDWSLKKAEADGDAGHSRIACSGDVVDRVADENRPSAARALRHCMDRSRVGLGDANRVAANDRGKAVCQTQLVHQGNGEAFRLVGADRHFHACRVQCVHCRHQAGIGNGVDGQILLIIIEQYRQGFRQ